jgi:penicillin-binding protein 1B
VKDRIVDAIGATVTLFMVGAAAADVALAHLYVRGAELVVSTLSIGDRDVRVLARPIRVAAGQRFPQAALEDHLRRIGYYPIDAAEPGCYTTGADRMTIRARYPELPDVTLRWQGDTITRIERPDGERLAAATIEPETIFTSMTDSSGTASRTTNEQVPAAALVDTTLADAIIASEDGLFRAHHGLDFTRLAAVPIAGGGASTITMQVARLNVLQERSRTIRRKLNEIGVAMAIERRYSKDAILTAYANTVDVGASHGRAIHGLAGAAQEFFGVRDIRQLTAVQAATLVALLNQPSRYLGDLHEGDETRLRQQRDRVLRLMQRRFPGRYPAPAISALEREPIVFSENTDAGEDLYRISRYFVDYATAAIPHVPRGRLYLTLDPDLQRVALDAVDRGIEQLASRTRRAQAAMIATNPHTGEVLAMVGGRSYDDSQFNRAIGARRQVGSLMKPFDYLAAFERAAAEGSRGVTPASIVVDEPTIFTFPGFRPWKPANYQHEYAGPVTWRRALAESRNVAAVKVASWAGLERVAELWERASGESLPHVFPSLTLGALEATPAEVATAYAAFATGGLVRPLRAVREVIADRGPLPGFRDRPRRIAREQTTFVVTDMMRAVLDEGPGRGARIAGFTADAAGKTGTTDNLRDAWFAGFTADLLAVVWVGRDDDQPLGLTGAQAALPIWTEFMKGVAATSRTPAIGQRSFPE